MDCIAARILADRSSWAARNAAVGEESLFCYHPSARTVIWVFADGSVVRYINNGRTRSSASWEALPVDPDTRAVCATCTGTGSRLLPSECPGVIISTSCSACAGCGRVNG